MSGTIDRHDEMPALVRQTQTIPAIDGMMFGVALRYDPPSGADISITVYHPPLGADGTRRESWNTIWDSEERTLHGYRLGLVDGSPVGKWTITGVRENRLLFRVEFDVTHPTPASLTEQKQCKLKQVS